MKKILITLCLLTFSCAWSFAQPAAAPEKGAPKAAVEAPKAMAEAPAMELKNLSGKVEAVSLADVTKGTKSEIAIIEENGTKSSFIIGATTTIYDADWKPTTLDKITKDEKVKVKYMTSKEGANDAMSINVEK